MAHLVQLNLGVLVSVVEGVNIGVLQQSENLEGWEMGGIRYELSLQIGPLFLLRKSFYLYMYCLETT